MKITALNDRDQLRALRTHLEKALANAGLEGITFEVGNFRFQGDGTRTKIGLEAVLVGAPDKAEVDFKAHAELFGLDPEMLGVPMRIRGHVYRVVGLKTRNRKLPVIAEREDGKRFKFREEDIQAAWERTKKSTHPPKQRGAA